MADLLTRPLLRRDEPAWGATAPWLAAILAAAWALVATLAMTALPGVAVWIGGGAASPIGDPLRFAARVWLASHRAGLDVDGGDLTVAPLGLTIVFVLLMCRSARWASHAAGVATGRGLAAVVVPAVLTYALGAGVVAGMSATPDVSSVPLEAVAWAAAWSIGAMTAGVAHESGLATKWFGRVPELGQVALVAAAAALAVLVFVGSVLVAVSAAAAADRIGALARALDAGSLGGAVLAVGGAAIVPNAIVWATSYALGPGFAFGLDTSVAPGGVELGLVPAVPALAALPSDSPGAFMWVVLAGPVLAGVVAGLVVCRRVEALPFATELQAWPVVAVAAATSAIAGLGAAVLALLSGGSAGVGRLAEIGPVPWQVGLMAAGLTALPAIVTVVLRRWHLVRTGQV